VYDAVRKQARRHAEHATSDPTPSSVEPSYLWKKMIHMKARRPAKRPGKPAVKAAAVDASPRAETAPWIVRSPHFILSYGDALK
jgi:hypothetical protein